MVPTLLARQPVARLSSARFVFVSVIVLSISAAVQPAGAQSLEPRKDLLKELQPANAATSAAPAQPADADDEAALDLAEPDFTVINTPTTMRLPLHKGNFHLTHRFLGNLRDGSFSDQAANLFGLDQGAIIGFEYRFAVMRHLEAAVYRTNLDKTFEFYGKYDAVHQHASMPLSASAIVSIEGGNNFKERYAPALGVVVSREVQDRLALYAAPIWVHNSAAAAGADRDTFYVGIGGRVRIMPTVYVVSEVSPRLSGYAPGQHEYGFGIEKRAGAHMFQLTFTNAFGTTFGHVARGGSPDSLYLGFNLARKFF